MTKVHSTDTSAASKPSKPSPDFPLFPPRDQAMGKEDQRENALFRFME